MTVLPGGRPGRYCQLVNDGQLRARAHAYLADISTQVLPKLGSPGENEPGPAVDKFAHGVKVPGMSSSLSDHMHDDRVQIV